MKKGKFIFFAGILGLAFSAAFCSAASIGKNAMVTAQESSLKDLTRDEDALRLKVIHYAEAGENGEKKAGAAPARQWEDKDTGFVIFGVTMGVSACLIGAMVTLSLLKKKKAKADEEEAK